MEVRFLSSAQCLLSMVKSLAMAKQKTNTKNKLKDGSLEFKLIVKQAAQQTAYQQVLSEVAKDIELKGFRKGKAPLNLVEKNVDKSKLYSRVLDRVLPPAYAEAVKKGKYHPIAQPQIIPLKMQEGKDWEFTAKTSEYPEVRLGRYKEEAKKRLTKARKEHEKSKDKPQNNWEYQEVFDAILATTEVEPAKVLIEDEAHTAIHKLESQLTSLKLTLQDYLKSIKKTEKEFHQEYHATARTNLRLEFALKAIVDQENPEVSAEEIAKLNAPKGQENYAKYLVQKQKVLDMLVKL